MRKVFHFDAPREKYSCDAAIVWCFDNRFDLGFRKYLKRIGVLNYDPIKVAGGGKNLASPEHESDRTFVLEQIRKSVRLHATRRVILMVHSDCGAYGGFKAFQDDPAREQDRLSADLRNASEFLRKEIPGVEVQGFYVDFEGIWEVDVEPVAAI